MSTQCCNHQGYTIFHSDDGYYWACGGYFATLKECQQDINEYDFWDEPTPEDTPSLEEYIER